MEVAEPEVFPTSASGIPWLPSMFEDLKEYLNWTSSRTDLSEEARKGPVIGLVLQRSHIVTGDDAHYVATIQELEFRGARVIPIFCGGLDFSKPVNAFFYDPLNPEQPLVDGIVSLTGFALVGGPARQDHPKAIESPKKLNRPTWWRFPVFQTTQEWEQSDLARTRCRWPADRHSGMDGAIEPIYSRREMPPARRIPFKTGLMPLPNGPSAGHRCASSPATKRSWRSRCSASLPTKAMSVRRLISTFSAPSIE